MFMLVWGACAHALTHSADGHSQRLWVKDRVIDAIHGLAFARHGVDRGLFTAAD